MGEAFIRSRWAQYDAQVERILAHQALTPELFVAATQHRRSVVADLIGKGFSCTRDETVWVAIKADAAEVRRGVEIVAVLHDQYAEQARQYADGRSEVFAQVGSVDVELGTCEIFLVRPTLVP